MRNGASNSFEESNGGFVSIEIPAASSSSTSNPSSGSPSYIEHRVSKMDTLAGVAIKYGVEVSDIRRMNGLVTDLQMFAHKSLQIPLPGRHPPSPAAANGSTSNGEQTPPRRPHYEVLDTLQSLKLKPPSSQRQVSSAMSSLQGYYGLTPPKKSPAQFEGTEMSVYNSGRDLPLMEARPVESSPASEPVLGRHCKRRSFNSGIFPDSKPQPLLDHGENIEISVRRRQKADADPALGSRTDNEIGRVNSIPNLDISLATGLSSVRKSSSTSNLQESSSTAVAVVTSSIWPASIWALKADAIARPIFDNLPKPNATRRNKAALD